MDAAPAVAAEPLVSIETSLGVTTLDKRSMLSGGPEAGQRTRSRFLKPTREMLFFFNCV
jgi:hypothetical protein